MKKYLMILAVLLLVVPSLVFSDIVSFKVGFYFPRAQGDPWETEFENMSFKKGDFQTTNFAFSYDYFFSNTMSINFAVSGYTKNKSGIYEDYVAEEIHTDNWDYFAFDYGQGDPISHVFSVSMTPIQLSLKFTPLGRKGKFIPFIGGGVGAYIWSVRISGSQIDFANPELFYDSALDADVEGYPVFADDLRAENKIRIGFHGIAGVMVPVANRISLEGELKYNYLQAAFTQLDGMYYVIVGYDYLDLSGWTFSVGLNYWF